MHRARILRGSLAERREEMNASPKGAINVCSLFNGVGFWLEAARQLGLPMGQVHVCENDEAASRVNAQRHPCARVDVLPQDVECIREEHVVNMGRVDVFYASPPCTDFSRLKVQGGVDGRAGLRGRTGRLFRKTLEVLAWVRKHNPHCQFAIENVEFADMVEDWSEICGALGTPVVLNARDFSYTWRKRAFWSSVHIPPHVVEEATQSVHPDEVLDQGRVLASEVTTITASWSGDDDNPVERTRAPMRVRDEATGKLSYLRPAEAERLLGLPTGYTQEPAMTARQRLHMLGNGLDIHVLRLLLGCMRWRPVREEEAAVRQLKDGVWRCGMEDAVAAPLTLDAVAMAEWLTPGACPCKEEGQGWQHNWLNPSLEGNLEGWAHGARLRYEGDRDKDVEVPNCGSCYEAVVEARAAVWDEVEKGRVLGPFPVAPLCGFKVIPRAMVDERAKSGKFRPISANNLPEGEAVNEGIAKYDDPICMATHKRMQQLMRHAKARSGKVVLATRDIKSAYRNVQVHPADWHLCGLQWDGQLFIDTHLSFGCRSSVDRFLTVSDALEWVLRRWGVTVVHYVDDFIFIADSDEEAAEAVRKFEVVCAAWGLPIKQEKNVGPGPCVKLLGVVYDMDRMVALMPEETLLDVRARCHTALDGGLEVKAAESLVGVLTWASHCVSGGATFVQAIRSALTKAKQEKWRSLHLTRRVKADLSWWIAMVDLKVAAEGVQILPMRRVQVASWWGDAGSEWGMGAVSATSFYRAKHPPHVLRSARRKARLSSKYLELFQLLVLARINSAQWAGAHVRVHVDNKAMLPLFRKMYSRHQGENDIVREVAMWQAVHGWSWELVWVPRELNEAADALSKNDMDRFFALVGSGRQEISVGAGCLAPPSLQVDPTVCCGRGGVTAVASMPPLYPHGPADVYASPTAPSVCTGFVGGACPSGIGQAWGEVLSRRYNSRASSSDARGHRLAEPTRARNGALCAQRPTRQVLAEPLSGVVRTSGIEAHLQYQLDGIRRQIRPLASCSGVRSYLRFAQRLGWNKRRFLPEDRGVMVNNLCLYALDAVQAYSWAVGAVMWNKKAIAPSSLSSYLTKIAKWYHQESGQGPRVHLEEDVKSVVKILVEAFPKGSRQKEGFTVGMVRRLVSAVRAEGGDDALMWEALITTSWLGLFRPGECVVATQGGFDAASNPTMANVEFHDDAGRIWDFDSGRVPTFIRFVVKKSKTDQDRVMRDVHIGTTGDASLCAVSAMWNYARASPQDGAAPLFRFASGQVVTYQSWYVKLMLLLDATGLERCRFGAHSFRIGGAQALAAAGRSITYIMAYGRWTCTASVLRYVKTPEFMRQMDAADMVMAQAEHPWQHVLSFSDSSRSVSDQLWCARQMVHTRCHLGHSCRVAHDGVGGGGTEGATHHGDGA